MTCDYVHIHGEGDFKLMTCGKCWNFLPETDAEGYLVGDGKGRCRKFDMQVYEGDFCSFEQVWDEIEEEEDDD